MKISNQKNISFSNYSSKMILREINKNMPRSLKFFNNLYSKMGERQDIIINAIGTGVVAPIFIKYNNLSKTDSKTKTYSALRQTAMALIAVGLQAGITIPADKYIDKMAKTGKLGPKFLPENKGNLMALKRIIGLGMAFAMIPLSCKLLNEFYPKFVKCFLPNLNESEKERSSNEN